MKKVYLLLSLLILFSGCEKDSDILESEPNISSSAFEITKMNSNEIKKDKTLMRLIKSQVNWKISDNEDQRVVILRDSINHLVIDLGSVKKIESSNKMYHSYTFNIINTKGNNVLENIFISLQKNGSYKTFLVTYNISKEEMKLLSNGVFVSVNKKMSVQELFIDGEELLFNKSYIRRNRDGSCDRISETTGPLGYPVEQIIAGVDCGSGGGGSGGGGSNVGDEPNNPYDPGEPGDISWPDNGDGSGTGGGSTGGGTTNPGDDDTCIADADGNCIGDATTPTLPTRLTSEVVTSMFFERLGDYKLKYWWTVNANANFKTNLINYLLRERYTDEAETFALAASFAEKDDGEVDFENEIIKDLSFIGTKAECVYELLKTGNGNLFRNTIGDFIDNPKYKLILSIGDNQNDAPAVTDPIKLVSSGILEIRIHPSSLTLSSVELAGLILHEAIHAELFRIVDTIDPNENPNERARMLQLYLFYENIYDPEDVPSNTQHIYMTEKYVIPIQNALWELDGKTYPKENYNSFAWDGLRNWDASNYLDMLEDENNGQYRNIINSNSNLPCD